MGCNIYLCSYFNSDVGLANLSQQKMPQLPQAYVTCINTILLCRHCCHVQSSTFPCVRVVCRYMNFIGTRSYTCWHWCVSSITGKPNDCSSAREATLKKMGCFIIFINQILYLTKHHNNTLCKSCGTHFMFVDAETRWLGISKLFGNIWSSYY